MRAIQWMGGLNNYQSSAIRFLPTKTSASDHALLLMDNSEKLFGKIEFFFMAVRKNSKKTCHYAKDCIILPLSSV